MDGVDLVLWGIGSLIAVGALVRLMRQRHDQLLGDLQRQLAEVRRKEKEQEKAKAAAAAAAAALSAATAQSAAAQSGAASPPARGANSPASPKRQRAA